MLTFCAICSIPETGAVCWRKASFCYVWLPRLVHVLVCLLVGSPVFCSPAPSHDSPQLDPGACSRCLPRPLIPKPKQPSLPLFSLCSCSSSASPPSLHPSFSLPSSQPPCLPHLPLALSLPLLSPRPQDPTALSLCSSVFHAPFSSPDYFSVPLPCFPVFPNDLFFPLSFMPHPLSSCTFSFPSSSPSPLCTSLPSPVPQCPPPLSPNLWALTPHPLSLSLCLSPSLCLSSLAPSWGVPETYPYMASMSRITNDDVT